MNAVQRYIQSEQLSLKTTIPIDGYVKARPEKIETHKNGLYTNEKFHHDNSRKPHSDNKKFLRPDMHDDEINQKINNYRFLSDDLANVKVTPNDMKKIYPTIRKTIEQRLI